MKFIILPAAIIITTATAYAKPVTTETEQEVSAHVAVAAKKVEEVAKVEAPAAPTIMEAVGEGAAVITAAKALKSSNGEVPQGLLWAGFFAALFKALLSVIKIVGKDIMWFKTRKGKHIIKYSTLLLGGLAALSANLMFGMSWMDAGMILLAGPLSVALNEYAKNHKDSSEPMVENG